MMADNGDSYRGRAFQPIPASLPSPNISYQDNSLLRNSRNDDIANGRGGQISSNRPGAPHQNEVNLFPIPVQSGGRSHSTDRSIFQRIISLENELKNERVINDELHRKTQLLRLDLDNYYHDEREKLISYYEQRFNDLRRDLSSTNQSQASASPIRDLSASRKPTIDEIQRVRNILLNTEDTLRKTQDERDKQARLYEDQVMTLQRELENLRREHDSIFDDALNSEKERAQRAENELALALDEIAKLQAKLANSQSEYEHLTRLHLSSKADNEELNRRAAQMERRLQEIPILQQQIDRLNFTTNEKEARLRELELALAELEAVKRRNADLLEKMAQKEQNFQTQLETQRYQYEMEMREGLALERQRWEKDLEDWISRATRLEMVHIDGLHSLKQDLRNNALGGADKYYNNTSFKR
jgi:chromosome segregation ATPase